MNGRYFRLRLTEESTANGQTLAGNRRSSRQFMDCANAQIRGRLSERIISQSGLLGAITPGKIGAMVRSFCANKKLSWKIRNHF
jgi:hypothetical protein